MKEIILHLQDGKKFTLNKPQKLLDFVKNISPSLAKKALFAKLNGNIIDLHTFITSSGKLEIITDLNDPDYFALINHSCAHLMATAISHLYPDTKFWVGPNIKEGFYYDVKLSFPISPQTLIEITKEMNRIIAVGPIFSKEVITKQKALSLFSQDKYKNTLLKNIDNQAEISLYHLAKFTDLCRGPHIFHVKSLKYFKLLATSGAYFLNDQKNEILTRIYGTCWPTKEALENHLAILKLRKENDHRKIGKNLEIFMFDNHVGQGLPIWLPNGMAIKQQIANFIHQSESDYGFQFVSTPIMGKVELYKTSGHWKHYRENMYPLMKLENERLVLRPMSCPHHCIIYKSKIRSYRDLPIRYAEEVIQHRYEASGALTGLERVRAMSLTDAHIFCTIDNLTQEFGNLIKFIQQVVIAFNIKIKSYRLSLHDPENKEDFFSNQKMWSDAELILENILKSKKLKYERAVGDAAFYGPKLDIQVETIMGHDITLSTLQLDFLLPEKFDLSYINHEGKHIRPIIIHRGLIGTYERFVSILLEQTKGQLPTWLTPIQIALIPVHEQQLSHCKKLQKKLQKNNLRVKLYDSDARLSYKIRETQIAKIPYQLVIGQTELETNSVQVRKYHQKGSKSYFVNEFIKDIKQEIKLKQ